MKKIIIILLALFFTNCFAISLQKAKIYNDEVHEIKNWYMSEKLDGIRAYWNGKELLSKNGNKIYAPKWFTKNFPIFELDGELYTKRADFENIQSIVLDKIPNKEWEQITYNVFEVPNTKGNFLQRLEKIKTWNKLYKNKYIKIIPQIKCKNKTNMNKYLEKLINQKAEGLMLKNPELEYFDGRSSNILKVKKFSDAEAKVIAINYKDNKFKSLVLKMPNNVVFNLGNGFKKEEKINHPKINDIVTFKYYGLTKNLKPKFASFLRIRKNE